MTYMGNVSYWEGKFKQRELKLLPHEQLLETDLKYFPSEAYVLDLACGDGRNAIYLAEKGYQVSAIDFSRQALERLQYFAKQKGNNICDKIKCSCIDIDKEGLGSNTKQYNVIVTNHYRLSPRRYGELERLLLPGGILWVNGFREVPEDNPGITDTDLLRDTDFEALQHCCRRDKLGYESNGRKFVRYLFQRVE
ncbi:MAG: class I SAM-dependent methyltransferase [Acetatifactor sp.]|nr:class I SAM-dependent methyltransferase [Acetatifactor sp.]